MTINSADEISKSEVEKLRQQVELTKKKKLFFDNLKKAVPIIGFTISAALFIMYYIFESKPLAIIGSFYLVVAIAYPLTNVGKSIELEIDALQSEISLKSTGTDATEERAERLFKSHEIDLKRYYDLALKQNSSIFIAGLICLILGFVFIGLTISFLYYNQKTEIEIQLLIGIIGSLGSLMTNFIALVYLRMYSNTLKSFSAFHKKLVSTNHLHFSNFLISKISDSKIKNEALKGLSEKIVENLNTD